MKNKELDSELNLIAFISLLSVLICSLLLTAIWIQIGTINVKQAIGSSSDGPADSQPSVWAKMQKNGDVLFQVEQAPKKLAHKLKTFLVPGENGQINPAAVLGHLEILKEALPEVEMALVKPNSETPYEDIIELMDQLKKIGLMNLGVAPL